MRKSHVLFHSVHRPFVSKSDYQSVGQGPWLFRELIPDKKPVFIINSNELNANDSAKTAILHPSKLLTEFRQLATFSWFGTPENPVMVIPGAIRRLRTDWTGGDLRADVEEMLVSRNLYMAPEYPVESTFVAVQKCSEFEGTPQPNFNDFDIVTDRCNLRHLLEFCRRRGRFPAACDGGPPRAGIRIDVQRVGDRLIVFNRREPTLFVPSSMPNKRTYGNDFRAKVTENTPLFPALEENRLLRTLGLSSSPESSEGPRASLIASCRFGRLKLLIRSSVAAVDMAKSQPIHSMENDQNMFSIETLPGSNLRFIHAGKRYHYHTVDLVTRSRQRRQFPAHKLSQMYFAQSNALAVGWYWPGNGDVCKSEMKMYSFDDCWEIVKRDNEIALHDVGFSGGSLRQLRGLLTRIVDFIRCQPDGRKFAIVWPRWPEDELHIYEKIRTNGDTLPPYLMKAISS